MTPTQITRSASRYEEIDPTTDLPYNVDSNLGAEGYAIEVIGGTSVTLTRLDGTSVQLTVGQDPWFRVLQFQAITACDGSAIIVYAP